VDDERLAALAAAFPSIPVTWPGAWDGINLIDLVNDLRDARAELRGQRATPRTTVPTVIDAADIPPGGSSS